MNKNLALFGFLGIAILGIYYFTHKSASSHKYQVNDILYNPPDTADNFTITTIQDIGGVLYYNFIQNQTHVTFTEPVSLVDNSSAWAKL